MNDIRRARLADALFHLMSIHNVFEQILAEEQDALEKHTKKNLESSPAGIEMEEAISVLEPIVGNLEDALDELKGLLGIATEGDPSA